MAQLLLALQEGLSPMELVNYTTVQSEFFCSNFLLLTLNADGIIMHAVCVYTVLKFLIVLNVNSLQIVLQIIAAVGLYCMMTLFPDQEEQVPVAETSVPTVILGDMLPPLVLMQENL
jgi:hypothetical protein